MATTTIDIVLAAHNADPTLEQALSSVEHQTYPHWQLICINDASTDHTTEIFKTWQKKLGTKMKVITHPTNAGLTVSLNRGIASGDSKYIARLDADDWWTPTKLTEQLEFLKTNPDVGLLGCWYINHYSQHEKTIKLPTTHRSIHSTIFRRNPFGHSCVIFQRRLWQHVNGYNESLRYGQDLDLWFRLLPRTQFANLPKVLCHRHIGSQPHKSAQVWQKTKTLHHFIQHYHASPLNYFYLLEPLLVGLWHRLKNS
jgi:glycosyltransferase involved in cell wall biosynthesis